MPGQEDLTADNIDSNSFINDSVCAPPFEDVDVHSDSEGEYDVMYEFSDDDFSNDNDGDQYDADNVGFHNPETNSNLIDSPATNEHEDGGDSILRLNPMDYETSDDEDINDDIDKHHNDKQYYDDEESLASTVSFNRPGTTINTDENTMDCFATSDTDDYDGNYDSLNAGNRQYNDDEESLASTVSFHKPETDLTLRSSSIDSPATNENEDNSNLTIDYEAIDADEDIEENELLYGRSFKIEHLWRIK